MDNFRQQKVEACTIFEINIAPLKVVFVAFVVELIDAGHKTAKN